MKRIIFLTLISAAFIYHLLPEPEEGPQIDQIRTRMAASRSRPEEVTPAVHHVSAALVEEPVIEEELVSENAVTAELSPEELAHTDEVPWEDLKQGWRIDLRDFLLEADRERGEEIYTSYMEESESFEAEVDALAKEAEKAGKEGRQDFENVIGQLEVRHEEKLKEILGNYYSEVTDRHQQYNTSIQYLNRSDADIVGVSL
jgi:hypothetical protein